jgi:hypothetical protein
MNTIVTLKVKHRSTYESTIRNTDTKLLEFFPESEWDRVRRVTWIVTTLKDLKNAQVVRNDSNARYPVPESNKVIRGIEKSLHIPKEAGTHLVSNNAIHVLIGELDSDGDTVTFDCNLGEMAIGGIVNGQNLYKTLMDAKDNRSMSNRVSG